MVCVCVLHSLTTLNAGVRSVSLTGGGEGAGLRSWVWLVALTTKSFISLTVVCF